MISKNLIQKKSAIASLVLVVGSFFAQSAMALPAIVTTSLQALSDEISEAEALVWVPIAAMITAMVVIRIVKRFSSKVG